ncbi:MAG TPA: rhomboid family intramembrane serine protease, partial [Chitinophagaceae bacterium]|nr:rhomboid family intramembrane serine protease [Chitinophagaceae bacterium]
GASGAIFGLYGVFLALLSTNLVPKHIRNSLLQSIGVFVAYNLIYGMKSGVDNAAHIGGLVSGLLIGYLYYLGLKPPQKKNPLAIAGILIVVSLAAAFFYLNQNKVSKETRLKTKTEMDEYKFPDAAKYNEQLNKFAEAEEKALTPLKTDVPDPKQLEQVTLPAWDTAERAVDLMQSYRVSAKAIQEAELLKRYVLLRKEEARLKIEISSKGDTTKSAELDRIYIALDSLFTRKKALNENKQSAN